MSQLFSGRTFSSPNTYAPGDVSRHLIRVTTLLCSLTSFDPKTLNPKPQTLNPKP